MPESDRPDLNQNSDTPAFTADALVAALRPKTLEMAELNDAQRLQMIKNAVLGDKSNFTTTYVMGDGNTVDVGGTPLTKEDVAGAPDFVKKVANELEAGSSDKAVKELAQALRDAADDPNKFDALVNKIKQQEQPQQNASLAPDALAQVESIKMAMANVTKLAPMEGSVATTGNNKPSGPQINEVG